MRAGRRMVDVISVPRLVIRIVAMTHSPLVVHDAGRESSRVYRPSFWLSQLPYVAVFALTILGVAYTSFSHQRLAGYWEFIALVMAAVCITTGWPNVHSKKARLRLVWTQALHWIAFLVTMNIVLSTGVQMMLTTPTTGLALLMLLALGTFVAGVH